LASAFQIALHSISKPGQDCRESIASSKRNAIISVMAAIQKKKKKKKEELHYGVVEGLGALGYLVAAKNIPKLSLVT